MTGIPVMTSAYQAALHSAAFFVVPDAGCLNVAGRDRVQFLQRQSTNDLELLQPGSGLPTVLTSPNARLVDAIYLVFEADGILALTLPARAASTAAYLRSRIFFMDQVQVEERSTDFLQFDMLGPQILPALQELGFSQSPAPDQVASCQLQGHLLRLLHSSAPFWLGSRLLVPAEAGEQVIASLQNTGLAQLSPPEYHILRVEAGLPWSGFELNEDYTPLETGLQAAVSDTKGCYTGQEVLARQVTYDKITQQMVGLHLESAIPADQAGGAVVWVAGRSVGRMTTFVRSPRFGSIALAVLRRPHFEPGVQVWVGISPEQSIPAQVRPLPFSA